MNPIAARVTGIQHIGLPTNDLKKTVEFYQSLGFEITFETTLPTDYVVFLQLIAITIGLALVSSLTSIIFLLYNKPVKILSSSD